MLWIEVLCEIITLKAASSPWWVHLPVSYQGIVEAETRGKVTNPVFMKNFDYFVHHGFYIKFNSKNILRKYCLSWLQSFLVPLNICACSHPSLGPDTSYHLWYTRPDTKCFIYVLFMPLHRTRDTNKKTEPFNSSINGLNDYSWWGATVGLEHRPIHPRRKLTLWSSYMAP